MNRQTLKVEFFQADCRDCRHVFRIPLLSDFDYGNFILHGKLGTAFVFVSALEEPWEEIKNTLSAKVGDKSKPDFKNIARFQRVVALCADVSNGQEFGLFPVCPACGSQIINYGDSKSLGIQGIPFAKFSDFMSKPKLERQKLVLDFWDVDERLRGVE
jgi:hypothetical protein